MFKPLSLDSHLDEAVERFCYHKEKVEAEARDCDMIEAAEGRKAQLILLAAERRRKLLSKLSNANCNHRHQKLLKVRHPGAGNWLTGCDTYQTWLSAEGASILCCYGIRKYQAYSSHI
jgi:hypothetical protein